MTYNEKKLQELHLEISRRIERRVSRFITRIAVEKGINIQEVVEKHSAHVNMLRSKLKHQINLGYEKEIATIERAIKIEESKIPRKTKLEREYEFIKDKVFNEQLGYRKIALLLGKNERYVQKIVVKIMCESVA